MLRWQFRQSNVESLATDKAVFFGPFADLVVFKEFHCHCPVWLTASAHPRAARDGAMIIPDASGAARRVQRLLGGTPSATLLHMTIKARVNAGRLVVDEPTDLPDGTELELLPLDPGDWLDEADRAALHKALRESDADVAAGRLIDADEILKELRSR